MLQYWIKAICTFSVLLKRNQSVTEMKEWKGILIIFSQEASTL